MNATHIVIQNEQKLLEVDNTSTDQNTIEKITYSYAEAVSLPVLHVRCKVMYHTVGIVSILGRYSRRNKPMKMCSRFRIRTLNYISEDLAPEAAENVSSSTISGTLRANLRQFAVERRVRIGNVV